MFRILIVPLNSRILSLKFFLSLEKNFRTKRKLFYRLFFFGGGGQLHPHLPPATTGLALVLIVVVTGDGKK